MEKCSASKQEAGGPLELVDVKRIWDQAPHNAFTDLIRCRERWWCVLREGRKHVSDDGALRVISSLDGENWEAAALLQSETEDLRDPKISVMPDGRLLLLGVGVRRSPPPAYHQTYAWVSSDGKNWSGPTPIGERNYWLWRVVWRRGVGYGIAYATNDAPKVVRVCKITDVVGLAPTIHDMRLPGFANEASMLFLPDDTAFMLLRRDPVAGLPSSAANALWGTAQPPYDNWTWQDLGQRVGGPHMILLPDNRILAAVRLYNDRVRTSLCWVEPTAGKLVEALALPSGGDTSYAGLAWHDGLLWVSYYSSHEDKTSVYLAKARV